MPLFPQMLLRGSFLPPLPLPEPAISLAPSYPVALPFHHNDEMDVRWSCDHQRTLSSRRLLVTEQANSRRSTQGRAQDRAYERKEVPSSNKGKKDYWTSKSVAHARITGESRSQSRSTPSAVLEDTMHLVDLFLSAFAPSWIAKGSISMCSISMTIAHPAPRDHVVGAENARSRVLAGPRDSGRHFVSKCSHCACSVSHERGPNACSYVKSPPPPPTPLIPQMKVDFV